jgi:hypothetical protein
VAQAPQCRGQDGGGAEGQGCVLGDGIISVFFFFFFFISFIFFFYSFCNAGALLSRASLPAFACACRGGFDVSISEGIAGGKR